MEGRVTRAVLVVWTICVLLFLFLPIATIILFAFDRSSIQSWPIRHYTLHWFSVAWHDPEVRDALWLSVRVGLASTALALALGSLAAFAVHRFRFFGRETIALQSFFNYNQITLSWITIVIGHTTFCIVVIYNNVIARLRRTSGSLTEAS